MAILNSENAIGDLRKNFVMSRDQDGRALLRDRSEQFHYGLSAPARPFSALRNVMVGRARFELAVSWSQTGG